MLSHKIKLFVGVLFCVAMMTGMETGGYAQDSKESELLRKAAEQGDANSQDKLAMMYANGEDFTDAVKWWRKAADQGNAVAQLELGDAYQHGVGVKQNGKEAVHWWRKAADQGNTSAQVWLGDAYHHGRGVERDDKQAVILWQKSAALGNADARNRLKEYAQYLQMQSKAKDAFESLHKAADRGDADSQDKLAQIYADGTDVKKDLAEALRLWQKSADQGNAHAQFCLGMLYMRGDGVKEDNSRSYKMVSQRQQIKEMLMREWL